MVARSDVALLRVLFRSATHCLGEPLATISVLTHAANSITCGDVHDPVPRSCGRPMAEALHRQHERCVSDSYDKFFTDPYGWMLRGARRLPLIRCAGSLGLVQPNAEVIPKLSRRPEWKQANRAIERSTRTQFIPPPPSHRKRAKPIPGSVPHVPNENKADSAGKASPLRPAVNGDRLCSARASVKELPLWNKRWRIITMTLAALALITASIVTLTVLRGGPNGSTIANAQTASAETGPLPPWLEIHKGYTSTPAVMAVMHLIP